MRLDNYLVEHLFCQSRNKAQEMIKNSLVLVDGNIITKSSFKITAKNDVFVKEHKSFVSRAGYKLDGFLDECGLDVKDKIALDIGSSTGGFTDVLLQRGAKEVYAVDVGKEQLHASLRENEKVKLFEECDIRDFKSDKKFELIVSDVSFISLLHIIDAIDIFASKDIILLFKPQFEVGKDAKRDKNGVVKDKKAIQKAMIKFEDACKLKEWELFKKSPSTISGKEGNLEWCYYFSKIQKNYRI